MRSLKYLYCLFILIGTFAFVLPAHAQGPTGVQVLTDIISGVSNPQQAAQTIANNSSLNPTQAQNFLQQVFNNNSLDTNSAGQLLDGFMNGTLNAGDLGNVVTTIQNFDLQNMTQTAMTGVINNLTNGALPADLAAALTQFDLGQLTNISDLNQLLQIPGVDQYLNNFLANGGLPQNLVDLVSTIAQIGIDPSAFANQALGAITQQIQNALQNALPNVFNSLVGQLGLNGLFNALGLSIFSNFGGAGPINIPFVGNGSYEIFPREPQTTPVTKNCRGVCGCSCRAPIERNHMNIRAHVTDELIRHRTWMIDEFFVRHILPAMMLMTDELSATSMNSTFAFGKFFDAKTQMETERTLETLSAEAQKDYQLSPGICAIGTNVRYLAGSERKADTVQIGFNNRISERMRKTVNSSSGQGPVSDINTRITNFKETYCNVNDNARGLDWLCANQNPPASRINKDINATRTLFSKNTLEVDFTDPVSLDFDGEDIFALTSNLFSPTVHPDIGRLILATPNGEARAEVFDYMNLRSVMAKRSVAANTFAAIAAERSLGVNENPQYLKAIVSDLGMSNQEVETFLGFNPSYYAQQKTLTSYAFENPTFYTKLYESPANVARKDVALKALGLMLEDDFYDRQLESEATLAIMLEVMLEDEHTRAVGALRDLRPGEDD